MKKYIIPQALVYDVNNENSLMDGSVETNIVEESTNVQLSKDNSDFNDEE